MEGTRVLGRSYVEKEESGTLALTGMKPLELLNLQ